MNKRHLFLKKLGLCPNCLLNKIIVERAGENIAETDETEQNETGNIIDEDSAENIKEELNKSIEELDEAASKVKNEKDTSEQAKIIGDTLMKIFDNKYVEAMDEIEKELTYRRFYFYGDHAEKLEFTEDIQFTKQSDGVKYYDLRHYDDYVAKCNQFQWWKNFIVPIDTYGNYKAFNFQLAKNELLNSGVKLPSSYEKTHNVDTEKNYKFCAIIESLLYMGKLDAFCYAHRGDLRVITNCITSEESKEKLINYLDSNQEIIMQIDNQLNSLFGITKESDKFNSFFAPDNMKYLWFVTDDFLQRYNKIHSQYQIINDKMLNLIKSAPALTICNNIVDGVFVGGTQNIKQYNKCITNVTTNNGTDSEDNSETSSEDIWKDEEDNNNVKEVVSSKNMIIIGSVVVGLIFIMLLIFAFIMSYMINKKYKTTNLKVNDEFKY